MLVVLGVAQGNATNKNPLSFEMREHMVRETIGKWDGDLVILPSPTRPSSYAVRSAHIDTLIRKEFPGQDAVIYGSRDSFIHRYTGRFPVEEIGTIFRGSATGIRDAIDVRHTPDFRAGVIWSSVRRKALTYPAVDVAVVADGHVLLIKKFGEDLWRFPGSFYNPELDDRYEATGLRVVSKELPGVKCGPLTFCGSCHIPDWRYKGARDGVVSLLMHATYSDGEVRLGKGIECAGWVYEDRIGLALIPEHRPLLDVLTHA